MSSPTALGSAGVTLLAMSCWVVSGTFIVAHNVNHHRWITIPWVAGVAILLAGFFGRWGLTDNHAIRMLEDGQAVEAERRRIATRL